MSDNNVTGIVLDIPQSALDQIKKADAAIKNLEKTSQQAAENIKKHFDTTMVGGVDAFIKKLQEAQRIMSSLKMPTIDATGISSAVQMLAQSMGVLDKSTTTGAKRLVRIADAIAALHNANPDASLFYNIATGIQQIGNMSQVTIDKVKELAIMMAQLARDIQKVQNAQNAINNDTASASQINKLYKEQADLVRQMNAIKDKGVNATMGEINLLDKMRARYDEILQKLLSIQSKRQTAASELAFERGSNKLDTAISTTTQRGAIQYAQEAKSLKELQDAYKNLKTVMSTVDPKSKAWTEMNTTLAQTRDRINEVKKNMGEFKARMVETSNFANNLKNSLVALFSISAIKGYINKLVEVRAQMELQQTALRAILQDKDEADRVFSQVQKLAMQSPFTIQQMTTFTKQLAAYRVESEKLVDTTKMLADVSAGLGVDMGRLILAYGQVKSANYLRATEVRQFTEAGLNISGELAKYFSEIQGKMVSVGDVMEMITKRMVRFGDVEEVFKRITSAGGLFYDMQKKQSETLWGQLQRIKDALTIMFNEIGTDKEGIIIGVVTAIRDLINNWRVMAAWIKSAAIAFGVYKTATLLATFAQSTFGKALANTQLRLIGMGTRIRSNISELRVLTLVTKTAVNTLKGLAATAAPALLIWGIVELINHFIEAKAKADELNESLERIGSDSTKDLNDALANFKRLTDTITDTTKTYTEHEEAVQELKRTYGEIIPLEKISGENLKHLKENYDELTATIIKYYQEKEYQKKADAILESDYAEDTRKSLEEALLKANKNMNLGMLLPEGQVKEWADKIADELMTGKIPRSVDALRDRIKEVFGKDALVSSGDLEDAIDEADELANKMGHISLATANAANAQDAYTKSVANSSKIAQSEMGAIQGAIISTQLRIEALKKANEGGLQDQKNADNFYPYQNIDYEKQLEIEQQNLARLQQQLNDVNAARAALVAQDFKKDIEDETKKLTDQITAWWDNYQALKSLEKQGKQNTEEWKEHKAAMDAAKTSADKVAVTMGVKVPWAVLETKSTTTELNHALDDVATVAFPNLAIAAINSMKKAHEAVLTAKGGVLSFVDNLFKILPDSLRNKLPDVSKMIAQNDKELAALRGELSKVKAKAKETSESVDDIYSRRAKANVEKFGADMNEINTILRQGADTPREMAKSLRGATKEWQGVVDAYKNSTNKADWLKVNKRTEEEMALMEKNIKAANALADEIWGEEKKGGKGGRGRSAADAELKRWQNIKKAIEETAKSYEDYRKSFSKFEADKVIDEQFGKVFKNLGVKISDYFKSGAFDTRELIDALKILQKQLAATTTERFKAINDLMLEIEKNEIDLKVKLAEDDKKKLQKDIDEMFANYELTDTLQGLGLNVELTYMVGGKPMTLEDIRKEITRLKDMNGKDEATEKIKIYEDALKKIADMENKSQIERLKQYGKYLSRSYSSAAALQLKYYSTLTKMQDDFAKTKQNLQNIIDDPSASAADKEIAQKQLEQLPEQAKRAAEGMRKEMEKELSKLNMDALFKDSMFAEMFQDLGKLSSKALDQMLAKINEIQRGANNLSLSQVRQLSQAIEKIKEAKIDVASWKELSGYIQKAYKLRREGISPKKAADNLATSQLELDAINQQIEDLNLIIGIKEKGYQIDGETLKVGGEQITLTENQSSLLKSDVSTLNSILNTTKKQKKAKEQEVKANQENVDTFDDAKKATAKLVKELQSLSEVGQKSIEIITTSLKMFGKEIDESDQMWVDFVSDMISSVMTLAIQFVALGIQINESAGIIGLVALALSVVANLLKTILGAHDAKINKQIDEIKDHVKDLENAYDDLADAIERAYTMENYRVNYQRSLDNIDQRINAQRQIIALEEEKKEKDKDAIRDANDEIRDLEKERAELMQQFYEDWGSISNTGIKDQAEEWVSIWLDAFKETGDGLDALMDNWDEFFENLVIKQAASAIVSARLKKYIDMINAALESETPGLSLAQVLMNIKDQFKGEMEGLNEDLKLFFESLGFTGGQGDLLLSDLQKGISNITEPQAAAIEAYLNSMRFAVFEQNNILYQMLDAIQAQYATSTDNPVLNELKGIRALVSSIDNRLSKVIVSRSAGASSYVVKIS